MKNCVDCSKELPDTAVHCVFCGAKQPATGGGSQAKTIMGYAAADLLKELDKKQGQPGAIGAGAPAPQQQPQQPAPAAAQQEPNAAEARTVFGADVGNIPGHPFGPGAGGPPPAQGGPPPAQGGPPPAQGGPPPAQPSYGAPPPAQPSYGAPPPAQPSYGAPPSYGAAPGAPMANDGSGPAPHPGGYGAPPAQGYGAPPAQGYGGAPAAPMHNDGSGPAPHPGHQSGAPAGYAPRPVGQPSTEQVKPLQAPPYLASQTAARMGAPHEPWADSLKLLMLVYGVLLIAAFVAPWSAAGDTTFSWDMIKAAPGKEKVFPLLIAGTGVLAVVLSLIPLATGARGWLAAALGILPPVYAAAVLPGSFEWRAALGVVGMLTIIPGLLIRNEYTSAMAGRILVTIGVLCVLAIKLIPVGGQVPLVAEFKAIGNAPGKFKVKEIIDLLPFLVALVSLVVWLPAPSTAGAKLLAWFFIIWPIADALIGLGFLPEGAEIGAMIKGSLFPLFWLPISMSAWFAFTGYGVATGVGKQLEHA